MTQELAVQTQENNVEPRHQVQPDEMLKFAAKQATALADVIERKHLFTVIGKKKHVSVEGWQTLGAMNSLQAFTESVTVHKDDEGTIEATAIVSARRVTDGVAIAQAEGFCSNKEDRWKGRDEYAIRSMAQTRATSKVFRQALAWIMVLAGYEATPSEEIPAPQEPPRIDNETRALLEKEVVGNESEKLAVRQWMRDHSFMTPSDFYRRVTNEQAIEVLELVGYEFGVRK